MRKKLIVEFLGALLFLNMPNLLALFYRAQLLKIPSVVEYYGYFPLIGVLIVCWALMAFRTERSRGRQITTAVIRIYLSVIVVIVGVSRLQRSDIKMADRFAVRLNESLRKRHMFDDVKISGYSCDFIWSPYIVICGSVESMDEEQQLEILVKEEKPPFFVAYLVNIGNR